MKPTDQLARTHLAPEPRDLARLLAGEHHDPHSILGAHEYGDHTIIRAFRPHAAEVVALVGDDRFPLQHIDSGLFAVALPFINLIDYRLEVSYHGSDRPPAADAYRFLPTLGEVDLHLFGEGRHERLWEVLGAHPRSFTTADGVVTGVSFAVWAPNAKGVSLIGEFNGWTGNDAPMRVLGSSGVWELFWPGFPVDGLYKFRVHGADGVASDAQQIHRGGRRLDGAAYAAQPCVRADEHLRGSPRLLASRAQLPPTRPRVDGLRCGTRVYPCGAASRRRAPVRRVMGIPGHVVLRADVAIRRTGRLSGARGRPTPGRHRCHRGLGVG